MENQPIRLYIIDDHALFRDGVRALLSATSDIECIGEAADGESALAALTSLTPDVVLVDISMPGINGIETTRRILRRRPEVGVIMVTMLEDDASLYAAMRAGARGYVLKGANHEELLQTIRAVAKGQALFGPAIAARMSRFFATTQPTANVQFPELTEREGEILELMTHHYTNPEIAQQLGISVKTISNHVSNILNKLQVADRAEAILRAQRGGNA